MLKKGWLRLKLPWEVQALHRPSDVVASRRKPQASDAVVRRRRLQPRQLLIAKNLLFVGAFEFAVERGERGLVIILLYPIPWRN